MKINHIENFRLIQIQFVYFLPPKKSKYKESFKVRVNHKIFAFFWGLIYNTYFPNLWKLIYIAYVKQKINIFMFMIVTIGYFLSLFRKSSRFHHVTLFIFSKFRLLCVLLQKRAREIQISYFWYKLTHAQWAIIESLYFFNFQKTQCILKG